MCVMDDYRPDSNLYPFTALIQILQIQQSIWFKQRIKAFQTDLQKILSDFNQESIIKKYNKTTYLIYHSITCLIISGLIRKKLGLDNRVIPFSKQIVLGMKMPLNKFQDQMRFHKISYRSCTGIQNQFKVRFDLESRCIDGYLKYCQLGVYIKGFCNQKGEVFREQRFNIQDQSILQQNESIQVDLNVDRQKFPISSLLMLKLINPNKIPPDFQQKCTQMLEQQLSQKVYIEKYNKQTFVVFHDATCQIISELVKRYMDIENRVIPFSNYMLLEGNIKTLQEMKEKMKSMKITFRICKLTQDKKLKVQFDVQSRCIHAYFILRQEGYQIRFCNEYYEVIREHQF